MSGTIGDARKRLAESRAEVAPPVDEVEPRGAREILIDRYMEAVRDELLAAGYLPPTDVREREAAAWDAGRDTGAEHGYEYSGPHANPFKGGAS